MARVPPVYTDGTMGAPPDKYPLLDCVASPADLRRLPVGKLPALVVLRQGAYQGVIEGMRERGELARPMLDVLDALERSLGVAESAKDQASARPRSSRRGSAIRWGRRKAVVSFEVGCQRSLCRPGERVP